MSSETSPLLEIENLSTFFHTEENIVKSVRNVDLTIHKGETLALVGESGCGKSVTALSIMRLISTPPGRLNRAESFLMGRTFYRLPRQKCRTSEATKSA